MSHNFQFNTYSFNYCPQFFDRTLTRVKGALYRHLVIKKLYYFLEADEMVVFGILIILNFNPYYVYTYSSF